MDCDLLVIGSGFGGSVAALRGAEAGMRVIVLERGPALDEAAWADLARGRAPLIHRPGGRGIIEAHARRGIACITASAVGGGSHTYTSVTMPMPAEAMVEGWPSGVHAGLLDARHDRVREVLAPTAIPRPLPRTIALESAAASMGVSCVRVPLALDWPARPERMESSPRDRSPAADAVSWLRGGRHSRKRSLDRTYLARAVAAGATIRPLHEANALRTINGGFEVRCRARNGVRTLKGARVVLAAGTLGTVRLLLCCRDRLRTLPNLSLALGRRFFANGDLGALLVGPRMDIAGDEGPAVTAWLDLWRENRLFLMEIGTVPILKGWVQRCVACVNSVSSRRDGHDGSRPDRPGRGRPGSDYAWIIGAMGYDRSSGRLDLDRQGRLRYWSDGPTDEAFKAGRLARLRELAEATGARLIAPGWPGGRWAVTVHPLGGARMADRPDEGVADAEGCVFGYPGLYIADGSLFPTPIGGPPSMPIAALAEHVMSRITEGA